MPINIDYKALFPIALKSTYPDENEREKVKRKLKAYGKESYHREHYRVKVGVLYLASQEPEKLDLFIELACTDYRDLLCAAEYPHSSRNWNLIEKDPKNYRNLQDKEESEYLAWVESIMRA